VFGVIFRCNSLGMKVLAVFDFRFALILKLDIC